MNKTIKLFIGTLISGVCLYFSFRGIHLSEVWNALQGASWKWFLPAIFFHVLSQIFRTLRWKILLSHIKPVPFFPLFMCLTFGFFLNNILPFRLGEVGRAVALQRTRGIPTSSALGTIALERVAFDLFGVLVVAIIALGVLPADKIPLTKLIPVLILGIAAMGFALWIFETKSDVINKIPGLPGKALKFGHQIAQGFSSLKSVPKVLGALSISALIWCTEVFNLFITSRAFGLDFSYFQAAALNVGLAVGASIPAAPGYVGTMEFFGKQFLGFLGFAEVTSLSYILVVHTFQILMNTILGLPGVFLIGFGVISGASLKKDRS